MKDKLTRRQRETLDFIRGFVAERHYPPTVREVGEGLGLSSSQTAHAHLHKLSEKGYLKLDGAHRAIRLPGNAGKGIPLIGRVAAGAPLLATENVEGYLDLDSIAARYPDAFALKVKGDSMIEAGILDGDYIVVRPQQTAQNGEIVVTLLHDEATVKYFFHEGTQIRLQPANAALAPLFVQDVQIVGKVIASFRVYGQTDWHAG
ncbi:MAG: transcriptional repressor LexA [Chloroflexi bacterium]|nr:transcriptional repressor LexA [Chloroflexota bacterium]